MNRTLAVAPLLLALALLGCAPPSTPPATSAPASPLSAAAPAAPATVCTGISGCRQVSTVDVDGDGRGDQVGVVAVHPDHDGRIVVRVRTADGRTLQTTSRHVRWFSKPYLGAAPLDGHAGAEVVVGDTMGAHYEQFRAVTYRAGRLVTFKPPPLVWAANGSHRSTSRWGVDGSYSFNTGISRRVSPQHVVTLTLRSLERRESGRGHVGHTTTYRWSSGRWVKVSARTVQVGSDEKAFAVGGWHVRGLRRFA